VVVSVTPDAVADLAAACAAVDLTADRLGTVSADRTLRWGDRLQLDLDEVAVAQDRVFAALLDPESTADTAASPAR
jgi:hypothetical protein